MSFVLLILGFAIDLLVFMWLMHQVDKLLLQRKKLQDLAQELERQSNTNFADALENMRIASKLQGLEAFWAEPWKEFDLPENIMAFVKNPKENR